ncbi:potassium/sodium hyperpolarization-activated cyclic nucleotide-gated channel 1 [Histomonas meleagridis]|uniref:potassium/sodium hyperpolarization-activated cyclic nucleotide-gated channel 1 n=1 Tax=Histomonas meleagridis TaxID=135588 RepID=UPI003559C17F|nr:potassium/sodium hyperpolarization-activated cyclic nucleotide-gated channel 1 [Histomonas meleagridis]KAH0804481.1 potassium/sodium hyperpolarization-activated cyclic nucleotide-gated channel 1 [Histomonas meleagridis]
MSEEEPTNDEHLSKIQPAFFDQLSKSDQDLYNKLRIELTTSNTKFKRYQRIKSLQDALAMIRKYCMRGDSGDGNRCLVCGVCWMGWDIAINTRQLRLLINKCKSSINGALAKMGYCSAPIKGDASAPLLEAIPFLKSNFAEQRMWSVRRRVVSSPVPMLSPGFMPTYITHQMFQPNLFVSPQPFLMTSQYTIPQKPLKSEISAVFGVNETSPPEYQPKDQNKNDNGHTLEIDMSGCPAESECTFDDEVDLFDDPCCCCPLSWANEDEAEEANVISF